MDARVLQSMLRDSNKLDLEQTSNMKKLLERGVQKDEDFDNNEKDKKKAAEKDKEEEEQTTYSSQVIKTLADTKFWKAFKRNAGEILESVAISVTNEIEKSAKVLVGLGFFAWDRAKQDVARALPTTSSAPKPKKKQVFQLGDTSSYVEPPDPAAAAAAEELEETPAQRARNLRQEFTTPGDEISAVSAEISKIFRRADAQVQLQSQEDKSKDTRNPFFAAFVEQKQLADNKKGGSSAAEDSSPFYASSSLSSTASRGSSRLESAFKRTQKTKLAKEKENIATKGNRLASAAIDSAYQVQKDLQSEQNIPGYKTKQLRESTVDVSKRIAGVAKGAAGFLGGASSFLLGGKDKEKQLPSAGNANVNSGGKAKVKADPGEFLDDASYFAFKRGGPQQQQQSGVDDDDDDVDVRLPTTAPMENAPQEPLEDMTAGIVIEDNKVIDNTTTQDNNTKKKKGGAFSFFDAITKRGRGRQRQQEEDLSAAAAAAPEVPPPPPTQPQETEFITDAEVVMENSSSNNDHFTTNGYLDNMEAASASATTTTTMDDANTEFAVTADIDDDGLRQVMAEVISDADFDESVFEQATAVDNMSVEELLQEAADEEAAANQQPNFVTKVTLRTLDVAFLVVEKGVSVAPDAIELLNRAVTRATEAKLKDSAGSQVGWKPHNGNVRGEKRY